MTATPEPRTPQKSARKSPQAKLAGALLRFRIMAFATGVVLLCGTIALILKDVAGVRHMEPETGLLWVLHGYLYLVYVISVLMLGLRARWKLVRILLVAAAGTIPTMSFVAEHFVTRQLRTRRSAGVPPAGVAEAGDQVVPGPSHA